MNICFQNIHIISSSDNIDGIFNLHIVDGVVANISQEQIAVDASTEIIDATGMLASPGFIDIHVHLREPGYTYKETLKTGTNAAANGGFTEIVCMPNTNPTIDNTMVVENIINKTKYELTKVHISAAITQERKGELLTNMHSLKQAGALYFTDDGSCVPSADVMKKVFKYIVDKDYLIAQHCEEHCLTKNFSMNESDISMKLGLIGYPTVAEDIIVDRDIKLLEYYRNKDKGTCKYHVQHISTSGAVDIVRAAKSRKARVSCEVTPHHLWFDDSHLLNYNANYKMNPPLRKQSDISKLIDGLKDGTIDCIASDHAPHSSSECEVEFERVPNGIIGLETSLGAVLTLLHHKHNFSLNEIINLMSVNPRRVAGLEPIHIKVGKKVNITIFSPNKEWVVDKNKFRSMGRNTPFYKMNFKGKPEYTFNNNQMWKCDL
jgi:dihydroorotase